MNDPVKLFLSIQYGVPIARLPRWKLRRWVKQALSAMAHELGDEVRTVAFTIRLVDADEGQLLNSQYRDKDYATNVLTFEYGVDPDGTLSGDIVLCVPVLEREAGEQNKSPEDHAAHLTVHGVLHSFGFDHIEADDASVMEALEVEILAKLRIANPYREP